MVKQDGRSPASQGRAATPSGPSPSVSGIAGIPNAGDTFAIAYPFVRDTYSGYDEEGGFERETWKPSVRFESISPEDTGAVADALGTATFTVVAAFKPGRFPWRVFFTRKFSSPDGKEFGKGKLHIVTLDKFRRLVRGYQHPFGIGHPLENTWNAKAAEAEFLAMLADYAASGIVAAEGGRDAKRLDERSEQSPVAKPDAQASAPTPQHHPGERP